MKTYLKYFYLTILIIFISWLVFDLFNDVLFQFEKQTQNELLLEIKNSKTNKITYEETGDRLFGENKYKITSYNKENKIKITYGETMFVNLLLQSLKDKTDIKFEYKNSYKFLKLVINAIPIVSSSIFMIYIISNIKKQSNKLNKDPKVSSSQKSLFTFKDVAGNEEEQEEMKELIDFLKKPQKYKDMGASIPKGVLLSGPPGTGKTLLAKAVAGEAGVSFYSVTGADFKNQYFGVGAARVRKLFQEIRANAPCVLFIDEIDTIGRKRGSIANDDGSTINQLLTEMDGFTETSGIIIMAATNRIDVLDDALLRPGRFDRHFTVGLPDVKAREAILKVHAKNKNIAKDVDFNQLAKQTPGMSGAQLASVLNEASILTVRNKKTEINNEELLESIDRVLMGPAKKSKKYDEKERKMVAYHEAGHAIIGLKLEHAQKVQKITIIPRGNAGGYNLMMPEKETFFSSKKRMLANITSFLGGRAAEELIFDDVSNGAFDDFKQATQIARVMVTKYGMSNLGPVQDSEFSDKKAINEEINKIINSCYKQAKEIIQQNKNLLDKIVDELLEKETINKDELQKLITN
ncbi:ATP-dependent zinc metalloprotease FtsH [Candidatus Phytoplasma pruni]|uniref:ATP-dependent zinc metalloprotease FtsH n=1 Tax=Candidatus Phytoplasma pruni TaxID=479893 RepID=A0A851HA50_9MOLU|nr:ATP-dependent zinc metalloprotease FtsH [Candidatus Phytoplasma pruni]NWN45822.1 ATP-dependent zinc metalloprotease FtsH [Candidatus Phytoplasma pruni]